jgi:hypothetical protein
MEVLGYFVVFLLPLLATSVVHGSKRSSRRSTTMS